MISLVPQHRRKLSMSGRRRFAMFFVTASILLVGLSFAVVYCVNRLALVPQPVAANVEPVNGEVVIPIAALQLQSVRFFNSVPPGAPPLRFIVARRDDRLPMAVVDACGPCGNAGHYVAGEMLVCRNCGKRFSFASLGTGIRNGDECMPMILQVRTRDSEFRVQVGGVPAVH